VGFTGSLRGGRALADLAAARPDPIPFHGELGSLNPVVVAPAAAQARPDAIAEGFAASMTLGVGQFCTKPGLLFAPAGPDGAALRAALVRAVGSTAGGVMLNAGIAAAYAEGRDRRTAHPGVRVLTAGDGGPVLHRVAAGALAGELLEECFGPASLLVEYADPDALAAALARLDGQLTATIHAEPSEADLVGRLMPLLVERAGRVVFDAYPTGVAVSWAMQHGGPWPASTSPEHTSVGAAAIRRWLRPVTYQNAPAWALPPELRDGNPEGIPRRLDGVSVSVNR
jgi:NADP-dependent aldehyde dehydrogenase